VLLSERLKAESARRPVLTNFADSVNVRSVPTK
jgi:hypothetical protein